MSIGMRCGIRSESVKWLRGCGIVLSCVSLFLSKVSLLERKIYCIILIQINNCIMTFSILNSIQIEMFINRTFPYMEVKEEHL